MGVVTRHHGLRIEGSRLPPTTRMIVSRDELGGGPILEDMHESSKVHVAPVRALARKNRRKERKKDDRKTPKSK